ncbi:glycosyltransferase family 2 protein [Haloarchaeobius amylolyticus]|uniref:glycosyltransferase family 2 protein n=1 Tax=Haloarchaeobius amylolyticus TaxID=1198296 RepID=UPI00226D4B97|nr:glycosyltransferase family 2 protein [Haloarchaeobius amylolyticus]
MYRDATVAVVVPAYNEAEHVGDVLTSIPRFVDRVYAIDDQSTDGTWDEICRVVSETADIDASDDSAPPAGHRDPDPPEEDATDSRVEDAVPPATDGGTVPPDIVPIRHEENRGAGGALKTGFERAREEQMDVTVTLDADGQMDPDQMDDLVEPVATGEAAYAKGNRLADQEYRAEMPTFRLVGNWLLSTLTKVASGYWNVMDSQNGYTAISHRALRALDLESLGDDHEYTNDILVQLNVEGFDVVDVPMAAEYGEEDSTISLTGFVPQTSLALLQGFLWRLKERYVARDFHPLSLFYGIGAVAVLAGILRQLFRREDDGSVLLTLQGTFLVLMGMVLDRRENQREGGE